MNPLRCTVAGCGGSGRLPCASGGAAFFCATVAGCGGRSFPRPSFAGCAVFGCITVAGCGGRPCGPVPPRAPPLTASPRPWSRDSACPRSLRPSSGASLPKLGHGLLFFGDALQHGRTRRRCSPPARSAFTIPTWAGTRSPVSRLSLSNLSHSQSAAIGVQSLRKTRIQRGGAETRRRKKTGRRRELPLFPSLPALATAPCPACARAVPALFLAQNARFQPPRARVTPRSSPDPPAPERLSSGHTPCEDLATTETSSQQRGLLSFVPGR